MISITLNKKELKSLNDLSIKRHYSKDSKFRDSGILIKDPKEVSLPHLIGLIGEYAWGKYINDSVDKKIYEVRDDGQDFEGTEVKTITFLGPNPELKIKTSEFNSKTPNKYVLCRVDKNNLSKVDILGEISRNDFNERKSIKKYGINNPENYIVGLKEMKSINKNLFYNLFESYEGCFPPGVLLPSIKITDSDYKKLGESSSISNFAFLTKLCENSFFNKNLNSLENSSAYEDRFKYELSVLEELGFVDYILLNWDIINFCKKSDIPVGPGRGSAAGSLVLYLIGVTDIDPVKYDLFFERFVSKSRAKKTEKDGVTYLDGSLLADIDNDIAYEHRQKVIDYIESQNPSRTSKILTLNTLSSKLCVKECGKIVGDLPEKDVNLVSDSIPKKFGKVASLTSAVKESEKFKDWASENAGIFDVALKLQGLNKNSGVHPSGIAISNQEILDLCPMQKTSDGGIVSAYDMNDVSELMVKFDVLGLRTLSVVDRICKSLNIDLKTLDLNDSKIFEPLREDFRNPHGIFQIEADTNFRVCRKVKPSNLEELSAVIAIGRPGALDFVDRYAEYLRTKEVDNIHPLFADVLSYTGGIPLYQEQLMKMAVKIGFSLDEAEQLRRIVGKKKIDLMPEWREKINVKIAENNLPIEAGEVLWGVAEDSANYSFNKSHSLSYATLSAWTLYLKFKHPQEFFLSLLSLTKFEPDPQNEINNISQDLPHFDIRLLPPDLGKSSMDFDKEGKNIRFGLNSIKGVSEKSLEALSKFRKSKSPNKFDVFVAAKQAGLNIGILASLIQAGCLSGAEASRPLLVLECQAFNLLTDREKRNIILLGEKFNYKLLDIMLAAKEGLMADDGKLLMKESRFNTFKGKYDKYKEVYLQNRQYEKFANWFFERKLLGYSYSEDLKSVFKDGNLILNSIDYNNMEDRRTGKFIGVVEDSFKGVSRTGNAYLKILMSDEYGKYVVMLCDNRRYQRYTEYYNLPEAKTPKKDDIISVFGSKSGDALFAENISLLNEKIYMKLGDLK